MNIDETFNKDEFESIIRYTQETPSTINCLLRGDKIKLYRRYKKFCNNEFIIDNLISTTDELYVASYFTSENIIKTILKITLPKGIPILNIRLLSHKYTRFILDELTEMILLPGKFNITGIKLENDLNIIECQYSQYRDIMSTLNLLSDRIIDIVEE